MPRPKPLDWDYIDRADFIANRFEYKAGEHLTCLAPTQWGKTTLLQQLADQVATPKVPAITMVMKPRDATVRKFVATSGFKLTPRWPPPARLPGAEKPRGYVLWPVSKPDDADADLNKIYWEFRKLLETTYQKGDRIVFADELFGLVTELGLEKKIQALYTRGAAMGAGVWAGIQRPAEVPRNAYSMSQHIFIAKDPDYQTQKRYGEIGGVDRDEVMHNLAKTQRYEYIYVRRSDSARCIVGM